MFIGTPNCFNKKTLNLAENAVERQDEKDRAMPMHGRSSVKQIKKTQNRRQHGPCFLCLVLVYNNTLPIRLVLVPGERKEEKTS